MADAGPARDSCKSLELVGGPVRIDGVAQVAIGRRLTRQGATDRGQERLEIDPVGGAHRTPRRPHELEDDRPAAGLQTANNMLDEGKLLI